MGSNADVGDHDASRIHSTSPTRRVPEASTPRRKFLAWLTVGLGGLAGTVAGLPLVGMLFSRQPSEMAWRPVLRLDEIPVGATVKVTFLDTDPLPWAGFSGRSAAWLRRDADAELTAFSLYCSHTGCPVQWEDGAELFLCPCHGGAFYRDGSVAAGPPPAPLERHPVRVRDGIVEIRTIGVPVPEG